MGLLLLLLAVLPVSCAKGTPGNLYPSTHFLLLTEQGSRQAETLETLTHAMLHEIGDYLQLTPSPGGLLRLHHYRWRINLWRHLNASYRPLRWRKAACYETSECYVIALSGNPKSRGFQKRLRHELSHYLLATHFSHLPPWIDEGVSEVMEAAPPFPRFEPSPPLSPGPGPARADFGDCLELLHLQPGTRISPEQYSLAHRLTDLLLRNSEDAVRRLHCYLDLSGTAVSPHSCFLSCWGLSMEQACTALAGRDEKGAR